MLIYRNNYLTLTDCIGGVVMDVHYYEILLPIEMCTNPFTSISTIMPLFSKTIPCTKIW